jgi:hypothetical protein
MPFLDRDTSALLRNEDVCRYTRAFAASAPVLCNGPFALQGEVVFISRTEGAPPPRFCGSDEATTCCIVFLRADDGSRAACAHLDVPESVSPFLAACDEVGFWGKTAPDAAGGGGCGGATGAAPVFQVHLVGSTKGWNGSLEMVEAVLEGLNEHPAQLELRTACVLSENEVPGVAADAPRRPPLHAGAALDIATGELRPARFASLGPDELPRRARCFVRGGEGCRVAFSRGAWAPVALPGGDAPGSANLAWGLRLSAVEKFLKMDDAKLLQLTSTSAEAEADGYVAKMREILRFIGSQL